MSSTIELLEVDENLYDEYLRLVDEGDKQSAEGNYPVAITAYRFAMDLNRELQKRISRQTNELVTHERARDDDLVGAINLIGILQEGRADLISIIGGLTENEKSTKQSVSN